MPYRTRRPRPDSDICHCYLDDYRFESAWHRPIEGAGHAARYYAACTPDFSLYPTWPTAVQIWNTYRSRWVGRWWQAQGLRVIPTVNWSDEQSFGFCFDGIPRYQILTLAVADLRKPHVAERFRLGVEAMVDTLSPRLLLVYGRMPFDPGCNVLEIPPGWVGLRQLRGVTLQAGAALPARASRGLASALNSSSSCALRPVPSALRATGHPRFVTQIQAHQSSPAVHQVRLFLQGAGTAKRGFALKIR